MVTALDPATRQSIVDQATAIAKQQGITPEQALYDYAQANGLSAEDVDVYMGFPVGTTQNWAVSNGRAPAPQGNTQPVGVQPLDPATRQSIVDQATAIAKQQGITPERALYDYAVKNHIRTQDIDTYMGWDQGTTDNWATTNVPGFRPSDSGVRTDTTTPGGTGTGGETVVPGSVVPGSVVPGSVVPGSVVPGSVVPGSTGSGSDAYRMPVLNALYQAQQQRMTSQAPVFNFQSQPVPQVQPGALTASADVTIPYHQPDYQPRYPSTPTSSYGALTAAPPQPVSQVQPGQLAPPAPVPPPGALTAAISAP